MAHMADHGRRSQQSAWRWLCLVAVACAPLGCTQQITVTLDPNIRGAADTVPTIEVDLVGLNASEVPQWEERVRDGTYWTLGANSLRETNKGSIFTMLFSAESQAPYTVTIMKEDAAAEGRGDATARKLNALWKEWKRRGVDRVMVIANLPELRGEGVDASQSLDSRRVLLPLDPWKWDDWTLELNIQRNRIQVMTPTK